MMSTKAESRYKRNASNNAGGNPTRNFSLRHKTFSALNYAQDFGPTGKESLKRLKRIRPRIRNSQATDSRKVELSLVSSFIPSSELSTMSFPSVQTVTKNDEFVKRDWIENFRPVWQRTIRSELTQDKASRDYMSCYLLSF